MPWLRRSPRRAQIAIGVLGEVLQADVAGLRVEHELGGNRRDRDLVLFDGHLEEAFYAGPLRYTSTVVPFLPRNPFTHLRCPAFRVFASTFAMMSPRRMPCCRRRALEERHDGDVAVDRGNRDAEPVLPPSCRSRSCAYARGSMKCE